jgi:Kelch motif
MAGLHFSGFAARAAAITPLLFLAAGLALVEPCAGDPFSFSDTGSLGNERDSHTATLLPNSKVLVAGGYDGNSLASAELYDPASGTWTATGSLATARYAHTATLLQNGKVLVAGGYGSGGSTPSAELYDPVTGTWTATGGLATARYVHTATLLQNGKVLVAGGSNSGGYLVSAELYDPGTPTPTPTATPTPTPTSTPTPPATPTPTPTPIPAPNYSLSINPSSVSVPRTGGIATYTVTITRTNGFSSPVTLSISGLPSGATGSFTPNPVAGSSSTLQVTVSRSTRHGTHLFTVTGQGGTPPLTRTAAATLVKKQN